MGAPKLNLQSICLSELIPHYIPCHSAQEISQPLRVILSNFFPTFQATKPTPVINEQTRRSRDSILPLVRKF